MVLTLQQLTTLKANLAASEFNGIAQTHDNAFAVALAYNSIQTPDFWVWRTHIPLLEVYDALVWTEYLLLTEAQRDTFDFILRPGYLNAASANIRQGMNDLFIGTTRSQLIALAKRKATRLEALLATGSGGNTANNPYTMTAEGQVEYTNIEEAWKLT